MVAYAEELAALKADFGGAASPVRGVFRQMNLWNAGSTLKACFYDGDSNLKAFFVRTAQKWLPGTSLKVDFGNNPGFRVCGSSTKEDIRITFAKKGYWSYIGTDSIHPSVLKEGASLNIETNGLPFERLNIQSIERSVLHETGHALGLLHEHQSPAAKCGEEFD